MRLLLLLSLLFVHSILEAQLFSSESIKSVNSLYDELNPVIAPDGNTIYFTIANHPDNVGGKRDPGDIWFSTWKGDKWSNPTHAGNLINDRTFNAVAGFSPDGNQIYLLNHYDHDGNSARTQGIAVSRKYNDVWSHPDNIVIPYFQNKSTFLCGTLRDDLRVFIFSAETYGTHGVDDLYLSLKENEKWSEPINLGDVINTQFQEVSPSLSADGKTLYFSSNGRKGHGSFDVYSTTRLDDSWKSWSEPVNLGSSINSEGRELYFRDYPNIDMSLFTSTKNSDGYGDMKFYRAIEPPRRDTTWQIVASTEKTIQPIDTAATVIPPVVRTEEKRSTVTVYGVVTNSKTGEPVPATMIFSSPAAQGEKVKASATGYRVGLIPAEAYSIKIEAAGFVSALEKLDIHSYELNELEMNFKLQPLEIGTTVNLKSVLFIQTKTDLLPESYDELDMVVSFLKSNANVKIELSGHTDNRGVHADNLRLSQLRVNSVKQYLVSKGIDGKRISGRGYGGSKPIASNDTEETRRMNRRVEFTIKKF
jgi:OmpA-OmpF porin, OOP family